MKILKEQPSQDLIPSTWNASSLRPKPTYEEGRWGSLPWKLRTVIVDPFPLIYLTNGSQSMGRDPWGVDWPFLRGHPRPSENTDICTVNCNHNNIADIMYQWKRFLVGVSTTWGVILKGDSIKKVVNHWYTYTYVHIHTHTCMYTHVKFGASQARFHTRERTGNVEVFLSLIVWPINFIHSMSIPFKNEIG